MKKNTIVMIASVAGVVLGTAGLLLSGIGAPTITELVSAAVVIVGVIVGIFSTKKAIIKG